MLVIIEIHRPSCWRSKAFGGPRPSPEPGRRRLRPRGTRCIGWIYYVACDRSAKLTITTLSRPTTDPLWRPKPRSWDLLRQVAECVCSSESRNRRRRLDIVASVTIKADSAVWRRASAVIWIHVCWPETGEEIVGKQEAASAVSFAKASSADVW